MICNMLFVNIRLEFQTLCFFVSFVLFTFLIYVSYLVLVRMYTLVSSLQCLNSIFQNRYPLRTIVTRQNPMESRKRNCYDEIHENVSSIIIKYGIYNRYLAIHHR